MSTDPVRVLHVDDEPDFAELAAEYLERENERLEVTTATAAAEGLDRLAERPVDCVVSDYDMPGLDGIEFLETVREEHPDLPFILFTGKGSEEIAAEAVRAGATDYLQKSSGTDQYALLANRVTNAAEKYAAEREVHETHRRFRKLLEGSADYVHILEPDGTITYVSPAVERVLGYEPAEVLGENALEYVHTDDRGRVTGSLDEVLAEPGAEATVEIRVRHAGGEWRWVEVRARNLLEDPDIEGIVANARDVTDRRESQATADWHRAILENLGEGVYVHDADYRLQFASHRVDGVPPSAEDWVGRPVSYLAETGVLSEDDVAAIEDGIDEVIAGEREEVRLEVGPAYPDETEAVELHLRPLPSPGGDDVVLGTTRDVTDRRRRATRLEALHDVTREMVVAGTHDAVAETAVEATEDILGLTQAVVFRYDEDRDALVPAAARVEDGTLDAEVPELERSEGVAWRVYETGETAVLESGEWRREAYAPDFPVESELLVPLGEYGVLAAGSTTRREFDDQTVSLAEILAANLRAAFTQVDRARELEEYERLVETMGDSVYSIDLDGEYIRVNETFEQLTGYEADRLLAEGPELVLDDEGIGQFEDAIRRLLQEGRGIETVETDLHTADGHTVPVEANLTLLPAEEGGYRGTVGVIRDITERREREQELERYETIVRAFPDEVYTLDTEGHLTSVIPPAGSETTTTGYDPEELVGRHVSTVMPEEDIERAEERIRELLASDSARTVSFEMHTVTRDGERIPNENHIALLPAESGGFRGTVGVLRNIADRKRHERELRRQNDRLEKFASVVSHDLRNPLNVASARLELAREDCDSPHLDDVERAHGRMNRLIEALLSLAREGEVPESVEELSLEDVAEQCWAHVDTGEATLVVETDRTVSAEGTRLRQLLENLVRNSVEHAGDGPVTVRVGDLPDGFYVEDDGPGIPPDHREHVFELGYSTAEGGTGLGLNIVEEIAHAHGWAVEVTEGGDGGARFEFTGVS
ncbi:PAS domain S-box protein [Salinirussus salinus]|uniref:PAS domain S-box protein n=1 Tax=Salinirussus salinus TaxID=1198300 RepID=UPI00135C5838|nr:PAS domain S-box protein [Salinirussus salinus]